ncbi:MAG: BtrH N-terminal domain-containing protein [Spirochaetales bacterium]|nr:BtrH N-terminal domain-containing protein [Spirochaetales bacterium]
MKTRNPIAAFPGSPALDGCHCQTTSLAKIYRFHGHPLSEEMLLGLGAGMGFIYWRMKSRPETGAGDFVFIGCRGNNKHFFTDVGRRTGVGIEVRTSSSAKKAEAVLLDSLSKREPMMLFGDMAYLPLVRFSARLSFRRPRLHGLRVGRPGDRPRLGYGPGRLGRQEGLLCAAQARGA